MPYGNLWKDTRRMAHHEFHAGAIKRFRPQMERATNRFIVNLNGQPGEKLMDHLRQ